MPLPEIEGLCRAIVPGAGSIEVDALGAGLRSETYRVTRDGVSYALKVAAELRELCLDLPWEVGVLELAARRRSCAALGVLRSGQGDSALELDRGAFVGLARGGERGKSAKNR